MIQSKLQNLTHSLWKRKSLLAFYLIVVLIVGGFIGIYQYFQNIPKSMRSENKIETTQQIKEPTQPTVASRNIPASYDLPVPYAPQAPFSNWTVHEESCEEAAIFMYHEFLAGTGYPNSRIPDATADPVYRDMKSWQVTHYGAERDLTMETLGKFAADYYGLNPSVTNNVTADDIKNAISGGSPVIVPVMTHSLGNSMYGRETVYHVLMIKGYDATGVITNDAGVGNGPNHHYDWNVLFGAIDAQTPKMSQGRAMLTLSN